MTTITDGLGEETRLGYDADSNVIEIDAPEGAAPIGETPRRQLTRMSYDGRDLPYATTTFRRDADEDPTRLKEYTRITEFDPNGNLRRSITPLGTQRLESGEWVPAEADGPDARAAGSRASKHATVFEFDDDNLLTATHLPWGDPVTGDAFDQNGKRFVQRLDRDVRGRITQISPAYDPDDTEEAAQIGKRRTTYTHFQNGWIKSAADPDHEGDGDATVMRLHYGYDHRGFQTSWRVAREQSGGTSVVKRKVTRVIAPNGTLSSRQAERPQQPGSPTRTYTYTYNLNHTLTSISDDDPAAEDHVGTRRTEITVNAAEQPVVVDETWNGGRDTTFLCDRNGNVTRRQTDGSAELLTAPVDPEQPYTYAGDDARTTAFTYDPLDREKTTAVCDNATSCGAETGGARVTSTDWYPSGQLQRRTKPNSAVETRAYFEDGRISHMTRVANDADQKDQGYEYDAHGNRTEDERGSYLYSARDGLIRWTRSNGSTVSYRLLGSGAINSVRDSAGINTENEYSGDRLESADLSNGTDFATVTYTYDELGAMRKITQDAGSTEYAYDEFERLRTAKGFGLDAGEAGDRYCYDALDRRALRIENTNASATCASATADTAGAREYSYVGLSSSLAREETSDGGARTYDYDSFYTRLGRGKSGEPYRSYALDANGTVEGLERTDGTLPDAERYPYDPYGRLEPASREIGDSPNKAEGELANDELRDNPFRFQGFYYDAGTQTYDMQARDYRPDIARFLSQDRYADAYRDLGLLADPTSQNRYAFAGANPVTNIEVDGHYKGNEGPAQRAMKGASDRNRRPAMPAEGFIPGATGSAGISPFTRTSSGDAPLTEVSATGTQGTPVLAAPPPRPDSCAVPSSGPAAGSGLTCPKDPKIQYACVANTETPTGESACASYKKIDPTVMNMSVQELVAGGFLVRGAIKLCGRFCDDAAHAVYAAGARICKQWCEKVKGAARGVRSRFSSKAARASREAAESEAAALRASGERLPTATAAAVDRRTGATYVGHSGELRAAPRELDDVLPKQSLEPWPPWNCAEAAACSKALRAGSRLDDLEVSTVKTKTSEPMQPCDNCRMWVPGANR